MSESMRTRILHIFTRTPLHVGAGSSVGAIDQPIQRERHTRFPMIPGSSIKGSLSDAWNERGDESKMTRSETGNWLFGVGADKEPSAGALIISEARLLAFPIRSAKGSFAWITCPLMLQRAARDGVFHEAVTREIAALPEPVDDVTGRAIFKVDGPLALQPANPQVVLEEYCFSSSGPYPNQLANALSELIPDETFQSVRERLVILSNGMMSHFAESACEVAQHVRISDETGTAEGTGLFNQENVPAETLFYSVIHATPGRGPRFMDKTSEQALEEFRSQLSRQRVFQFGGDASTGLGFCTVHFA